jgi:predicted RNA-binding protein with PIN domain
MLYIIDAYNLIHKTPSLESALNQDLRSARDALILHCRRLIEKRGDITEIILVFDGRSEFHDLPQPQIQKIEIIFSSTNETADERIIEVLQSFSHKKDITRVVSDDNFVRNQARSHRVKGISIQEFHHLTNPIKKFKKNSSKVDCDKSNLNGNLASDITEAYKKELGIS